jgi:hypothetical protein
MFADFRVHGMNTTFSNAFTAGLHLLTGKEKEGLLPDFLWSLVALAHLMRLSLLKAAHAAVGECHVAGNRGRPSCSTHVRESPRTWGTRPEGKAGEEARDLSHKQLMMLTLVKRATAGLAGFQCGPVVCARARRWRDRRHW